jgi:hypothetical protein
MRRLLLCLFAALLALPAHADGLSDLKAALVRLQGQAPLKGSVSVKSESRISEGKEDELSTALAQIQFDDSVQGLRLTYPGAALTKATQEEAAQASNPKATTPTASGLKSLSFSDVRDMARAAENLQRDIASASLKSERADSYQGQPARVLLLDVPQKKQDKYVKKFESTVEVWIAADGTPLASKARQRVEGSAFVVISFEMLNTEEQVFSVVGDRLIATKRTVTNSGSGAGQKGSGKREFSLLLG